MNYAISPAIPADIPDVARIHAEALPDDSLPSLGREFLERIYYPLALDAATATTLVARLEGNIAGFVTIASDAQAFARMVLRKQVFWLAYYALRAALRDYRHLRLSAEVALAALRGQATAEGPEILFIAVDPAFQGRGLGPALVGAAVKLVAGSGRISTTKTLATNTNVISMYERMGWRIAERFRFMNKDYVRLASPAC